MKALTQLTELEFKSRYENSSIPNYARFKKRYSDRTANGLTKAIIEWIRLSGGHAERVNTMGRPVDRTKVSTNCLGQRQRIGSIEWIPGGSTPGSSDIHATIAGRSYYIEVKIGRDRLSEAQKQYRDKVTRAGALYHIATSFDEFLEFYNTITG